MPNKTHYYLVNVGPDVSIFLGAKTFDLPGPAQDYIKALIDAGEVDDGWVIYTCIDEDNIPYSRHVFLASDRGKLCEGVAYCNEKNKELCLERKATDSRANRP